tara:strand:+ start:631 stop:1392 length:762 start_codon:yes stop_codon:yes gene_type:complete
MKQVFHLGIHQDQLEGATLAIVPGDPERVERIATQMKQAKKLAAHREFTSYLAWIEEHPVVICSTGIGGPSTSIAVEELSQLGITTFLRIGTTGAIQPDIDVGDMIVSQASVRLDGASQHFAPLAYPAASDFFVTQALIQACSHKGVKPHVGVTASADTFYPGQERYDTHSGRVVSHLQGSMKEWQAMHVLNYEMESATLFTQCATEGLRAGCVAAVIVNRHKSESPSAEQVKNLEKRAIDVVIDAARQLLTA